MAFRQYGFLYVVGDRSILQKPDHIGRTCTEIHLKENQRIKKQQTDSHSLLYALLFCLEKFRSKRNFSSISDCTRWCWIKDTKDVKSLKGKTDTYLIWK